MITAALDMSAAEAPAALLSVADATFGYGGRAVVRANGLTLSRGRCLGVFGHNGAGKTTLVRGLLGLLPPLAGRVERTDAFVRAGYLPQTRQLDAAWPMSGFDAAALAVSSRRRFGRLTRPDRVAVSAAMDRMDVAGLARRPFVTLSGGQKQRLLLAGALADAPDVLVLDEPTDGLDVAARDRLLSVLAALKGDGLCVVLISHALDDLLALADTAAWLRAGTDAPSTVTCVAPDELGRRLLRESAR